MRGNDIRLRMFVRLVARGDGANLAADVDRVRRMAEAILAVPALAGISKAKIDDRAAKKVTAKTRANVAATGKSAEVDYFDRPRPAHEAWVQFALEESSIEIRSTIEGSALVQHRATVLDEMVVAFVQAVEPWRGVAVVRQGTIQCEHVNSPEPPYARLPKPRVNARYPQRSLVTFLDRDDNERATDYNALTTPPPINAKVTKHDAVLEVRWAEGVDDDEIALASTRHDCWIRRIPTSPDNNFNDEGDALVNAGNATPTPPLTLYNPWLKHGFKAVLVTPEGKLEASALAEAQEVLQAKALPNGDEVTKVWLVLPLRAHAVAMHEQVVAQGFEAALYPGTGGRFWDPAPAGPWLLESTDAGAKPR